MNNGNVGIGINSPATKLQVAGDIYAFEGSYLLFGSPSLTNYSNTAGPGLLYASRAVGANYPFTTTGNVILQSTTAFNRDILFVTGTTPKERMVVKANGDVGINTPLPSGRFHVNNDVTGSDSSFVVTNGGNVGIGTATPISQFMVHNQTYGLSMNYEGLIGGVSNLSINNLNGDNNDNHPKLTLQGFAGNLTLENHFDGNQPINRYTCIRNTTAYKFHYINNSGQYSMTIDALGNMGLSTPSPTSLLSVNGTADKVGGGTWATFSDERVKSNITPFVDGLDLLMKLNPVTFKYNEKSGYSDLNKTFVGFIAQDVEKVAPYMVSTYDDTEGPSGLKDKRQFDESALSKIMLNAIQEQQRMIEEQNQRIQELLKRIEVLEKK
jgi:hypothetical protein